MPNLASYNGVAIVLSGGFLAPAIGATLEVRVKATNAIAAIYSDEAGTVSITNPSAFADANARFLFFAAGIARGYTVKATLGALTYTLDVVAVGNAQQLDASTVGAGVLTAADAAAARLFLGLTAIAAKGDTWSGTAANTLATKPAPANGKVRIAASSQSDGWLDAAALNKGIYGLTYANGDGAGAGDLVNDITIFAGGAMDATGAYPMVGSQLTKQLDAAWAVGNNAGGLDTGAIGNSDYHIWLIARSDTGVVDYLFSLSSTAPTMPANYDFKRLIGWFKRVGATIVAFDTYEIEGGGIELNWDSPTQDVNLANTLSTSRRTDTVKVPQNFSTIAHLMVQINDPASAQQALFYCPDQADIVPTSIFSNYESTTATSQPRALHIRTNASGQIAARSTLATSDGYNVFTMGFRWSRRN